jgi:Mrp family chromosome partitioning ATPase
VPVAERLAVLPAGAPAGDVARLYREPAIAALTRALAERFEAVVYLASTPWASADVLVLAPHVGAAVLAVRAGVDSADEMRRLKADLERAGVRLLGFTLVEQRR